MAQALEKETRRVLVVEDQDDLRELVTYNLEAAGYEVRTASDGEAGWALFRAYKPHLMVLDLMLPGIAGTEICKRVRAQSVLPQPAIIMLTARGDEIDRVVGFELGADDYVVKPFSMRELVLRVSTFFRSGRIPSDSASSDHLEIVAKPKTAGPRRILNSGLLSIDVDGHHVRVGEEEVHVSSLEMRLLIYLMEARGHVRSREQLLSEVWGYKPGVSTRTVDTHVKRLRDKLGDAGNLIETVRGIGYRFADGIFVESRA